jgi:hypothetical protein
LKKISALNTISYVQIGRERVYSLNDTEHIIDLLVTYKQTFFDRAVDQFVNTLADVHPKYIRKSKKEK